MNHYKRLRLCTPRHVLAIAAVTVRRNMCFTATQITILLSNTHKFHLFYVNYKVYNA